MKRKDAKEEVLKWGLGYGFRADELNKIATIGEKVGVDIPEDIADKTINNINSSTINGDFFLQFNREVDQLSWGFNGDSFDEAVGDLSTEELEQFGEFLKKSRRVLGRRNSELYQTVIDNIENEATGETSEGGINVSTTVIDEETVQEISNYFAQSFEQNFDPEVNVDNEVNIDGDDIANSLENELEVSLTDEYSEELQDDIDEIIESYADSLEGKIDTLMDSLESHHEFTEERFQDLKEDHEEIYEALQNIEGYEFSDDEINNIANSIVTNIDDGAIEVDSEAYVDSDTLEAAFNDADIEVNAEADLDSDDYDEIADRVVDRMDIEYPDDPSGDPDDGPDSDDPGDEDDGYEIDRRTLLKVGAAAAGGGYAGATKGGFIGGVVGALLGRETGNNSGKTPVNGGNGNGGGQVDGLRTGVWVNWETADNCLSRHNEDVIRKNLVQEGQYDSLDELEYMFTEDGSEYDVRFRDGSGNIIKAKYDNQDLICEVE